MRLVWARIWCRRGSAASPVVVGGEVAEMAGEYTLDTGELPDAEADGDNGIAGQGAC